MSPRIAIVGAGAVGGYVGAYLAKAGIDVVMIDAWPAHVEAIRSGGLHIQMMEPGQSFETPARALHICDVPQLVIEQPFDIAFISVKSYDTDWATTLILPYLAPNGCVVSLQNSINEERIAAIAGWGRTLGCCVNVLAAELVAPGRIVRNSLRGDARKLGLAVGEAHGRVTARATQIAELLAGADSTGVTTNLWGERWSKLTINAMRNGVCAMTGMSSKERDGDPRSLSLSIRLGSQSVRVGLALGLVLEEVSGLDLEPLGRAEYDAEAMRTVTRQILDVLHTRADAQRPSMAQDINKGRRTETDAINGLVARRGVETGVDASLHSKVNLIVQQIERGELRPSPDLLDGL